MHYCKFCSTFSQNWPINSFLWRNCRQMNQTWDLAAVSMQAGRHNRREGASFGVHLSSNGDDGKLQSSSSSWVHKNGRKRRSSEESLHHTHRENKLCRLCLALHKGCFSHFGLSSIWDCIITMNRTRLKFIESLSAKSHLKKEGFGV